MASLAKLALRTAIIAIFFSQLIKFSFDGAIIIAAILNIISLVVSHKLKIHNRWFLFFIIYAAINLFIHLVFSHWSLNPILYLIRLSALLSFFIFPPKIDSFTQKLTINVLSATVLFGIIQYIFWPNFTYFSSLNWDPHLNRIVAPFFDPTFTALIYLFLLIYFALRRNPLLILAYTALALTYSRASLATLAIISAISSFKTKNIKIFLFTFATLIFTIIVLPKPYGEGTKLDRTSSIYAKIQNYQIAFSYIKSASIFGYGYNRLPLIRTDQSQLSHAISGFDNSLLTIWAGTGIFGLFLFIQGILWELRRRLWHQNLFWISVLLHSCFANSLLYSPILFLLAIL